MCISADGAHGAALNNLAMLCHRSGQSHKAKAYLVAARSALPKSEEIEFNYQKFTAGRVKELKGSKLDFGSLSEIKEIRIKR